MCLSPGWHWWGEHRELPLLPAPLHDPVAEGRGLQRHHSRPEEVREAWPAQGSGQDRTATALPCRVKVMVGFKMVWPYRKPQGETCGCCVCVCVCVFVGVHMRERVCVRDRDREGRERWCYKEMHIRDLIKWRESRWVKVNENEKQELVFTNVLLKLTHDKLQLYWS